MSQFTMSALKLEYCSDLILQRVKDPRPVDREEWESLHPMNSYDRHLLIPFLADEVLADVIEHTLKNCGRIRVPAVTYEDAIQIYAEEAARRLICKESMADATIETVGPAYSPTGVYCSECDTHDQWCQHIQPPHTPKGNPDGQETDNESTRTESRDSDSAAQSASSIE